MNLTNSIAIVNENDTDKKEAFNYFSNLYPGIEYQSSTDTYRYRDLMFDYFKSGIGINGPNTYLLVSKGYPNIWLFTYGNKENRWDEFIRRKIDENATQKIITNDNFLVKIFKFFQSIVSK